jgi:hypothetical protein
MNTPKSHPKLKENIYAFPSPPWQALVSRSFLDQVLMNPSLCEDFDLELELSKLSLHLLPCH